MDITDQWSEITRHSVTCSLSVAPEATYFRRSYCASWSEQLTVRLKGSLLKNVTSLVVEGQQQVHFTLLISWEEIFNW